MWKRVKGIQNGKEIYCCHGSTFCATIFFLPILDICSYVFYSVGGSSGSDGHPKSSTSNRVTAVSLSRSQSHYTHSENSSSVDRPMRISEIHVAAEHALKRTISHPDLLKSLSSLKEFEVNMTLMFMLLMRPFMFEKNLLNSVQWSWGGYFFLVIYYLQLVLFPVSGFPQIILRIAFLWSGMVCVWIPPRYNYCSSSCLWEIWIYVWMNGGVASMTCDNTPR